MWCGKQTYRAGLDTPTFGSHHEQAPCFELVEDTLSGEHAGKPPELRVIDYTDTGGITLAPRLSKSLQGMGLKRGQRRFYVFGRAGRPCYHCGGEIDRMEIGGRRLYLCHTCQPG